MSLYRTGSGLPLDLYKIVTSANSGKEYIVITAPNGDTLEGRGLDLTVDTYYACVIK